MTPRCARCYFVISFSALQKLKKVVIADDIVQSFWSVGDKVFKISIKTVGGNITVDIYVLL